MKLTKTQEIKNTNNIWNWKKTQEMKNRIIYEIEKKQEMKNTNNICWKKQEIENTNHMKKKT